MQYVYKVKLDIFVITDKIYDKYPIFWCNFHQKGHRVKICNFVLLLHDISSNKCHYSQCASWLPSMNIIFLEFGNVSHFTDFIPKCQFSPFWGIFLSLYLQDEPFFHRFNHFFLLIRLILWYIIHTKNVSWTEIVPFMVCWKWL